VSFSLAWDNSWRAKWEEPAEKNVTGRTATIGKRDAAGCSSSSGQQARTHSRTACFSERADHRVPASAALDVGLSEAGTNGVGCSSTGTLSAAARTTSRASNCAGCIRLPPSPRRPFSRRVRTPVRQVLHAPSASASERDPTQPPTAFDRDDTDEPTPSLRRLGGQGSRRSPEDSGVKAPAGASPGAAVPAGRLARPFRCSSPARRM